MIGTAEVEERQNLHRFTLERTDKERERERENRDVSQVLQHSRQNNPPALMHLLLPMKSASIVQPAEHCAPLQIRCKWMGQVPLFSKAISDVSVN